MFDTKKWFPKNVWFWTGAGYASRPVTKADQVRRELYLINFANRQEARNAEQK